MVKDLQTLGENFGQNMEGKTVHQICKLNELLRDSKKVVKIMIKEAKFTVDVEVLKKILQLYVIVLLNSQKHRFVIFDSNSTLNQRYSVFYTKIFFYRLIRSSL